MELRYEQGEDLAQAFAWLRPLLLRALARLARQGLAVTPNDGLDLIHDFVVYEWPRAAARHDPRQSKRETYAYAAFVLFARRRIVQLRRWTSALGDARSLSELSRGSEPPAWEPDEVDALRSALARVPPEHARVLARYLEVASEREVASQLRMTRYAVREALVESLGRLAVWMGERGGIGADDWLVAQALWRDGMAPEVAARRLSRPLADVRAARRRILHALSHNLSAVIHPAADERTRGA